VLQRGEHGVVVGVGTVRIIADPGKVGVEGISTNDGIGIQVFLVQEMVPGAALPAERGDEVGRESKLCVERVVIDRYGLYVLVETGDADVIACEFEG
jgi:hypothetical protein